MGNHESKPNEAASRDRSGHREREDRRERPAPISTSGPTTQTRPVFIPASSGTTNDKADRADTSTPTRNAETTPVEDEDQVSALPPVDFDFIRPPRLPLAIGEEEYAPGSPIFSPQHLADNVDLQPLDPGTPTKSTDITRRTSLLSSTTADDEDEEEYEGRNDELQHEGLAGTVKSVPTLVEWFEGGDKVYVTGTFANWDRKIKLRKDGPSRRPGALSAMIQFPPGTHHIRFIADGDMRTSKHLPTAVDFAGFLVNYIEVVPGPPSAAASTTSTVDKALTSGPPVATAPVDIPANRQGQQQIPHRLQEHRPSPALTPQTSQPATPDTANQAKAQQEKSHIDKMTPMPAAQVSAPTAKEKSTQKRPAQLVKGPVKRYHSEIPKFLLDFDAPDESSRLTRANAVATTLPPPPSLPMFLAKSILNKDTPMKDDASVLVLPNHTVLNHLATSSIKNKVLATSATTRYNDKMLTTIMYKPTGERQEVS